MDRGKQVPSRAQWGGTRRNARSNKPSSAATEETPSLILHVDVDNGFTLSSSFARHIPAADTASGCVETVTTKEFASHLLAEFMWGTLDPDNGSWLPVEGPPSCSPPGGDDSLITYGQYLRAQHTAEPLQNPQVFENIRKALQSFGQQPPRKAQESGIRQRRRVRSENKPAVAGAEKPRSETPSKERVADIHAQLLKRMMLPLTLRLALGCEKANPAHTLQTDRSSEADSSKRSTSAANPEVDPGKSFDSTLSANRAEAVGVDEQKEDIEKKVVRSYVKRLKEGYWHIAPPVFHTLFAWLKRNRTFKVVLYTRDYPGGPHITRVIQELNDLCEGKHPAFDGQNRTKQVFLDGRKKTRDMRISPSQIGSVTLFSRKCHVSSLSGLGANQFTSPIPTNEETFSNTCLPKGSNARSSRVPRLQSSNSGTNAGDNSNSSSARNSHLQCTQESLAFPPAAEASPQFVWNVEFPSAGKMYHDLHEFYTGLIYELLADYNVICLCFGQRKSASAFRYDTDETAGASDKGVSSAEYSKLRPHASDSGICLRCPAADADKAKSSAFVHEETQGSVQSSQVLNSQNKQSDSVTDPKSGASRSRPVSATLHIESPAFPPSEEKCCQSEDSAPHGDVENPLLHPLSLSSCVTASPDSLSLVIVPFSLDASLVPLPVLVDPVDYSRYHVCISAPALLNVQSGLSYLPSLKVVEVIHGDTIFDAIESLRLLSPSTTSARSNTPLGAADATDTRDASTQLCSLTVDVASTHRTQELAAEPQAARSRSEEPSHSSRTPAVRASTSAVQTTFPGSYLVVSAAYCVIISDPYNLLCTPEHLLSLTEQCLDCRLRQLKAGNGEKETVVLSVENAEQAPRTVAVASAGGIPREECATSAQVMAEKTVFSSSLPEKVTAKSAERPSSGAGLAEKPDLLGNATRRTTLKCLDRYADLNAEEMKALHPRDYLKATIVPVLLPAIEHILKDRPPDPLAWIAFYLLRHAEGYERIAR